MFDVAKLDPNFAVETTIRTDDTVFYDVKENLFCLLGLIYENGATFVFPRRWQRR